MGNKGAFEIVLKDDTQALEEVVVVGYAAQKKVNLTGSVASLNFTDEKLSRPVTTIAASLSGMAAGVNVMNTSSQPNAEGSSILIRGVGTMNDAGPLILVDGMEMSLNEVNPNDVASISILKDAAATSLYGSRAANGVVLITTKRGKQGKNSSGCECFIRYSDFKGTKDSGCYERGRICPIQKRILRRCCQI